MKILKKLANIWKAFTFKVSLPVRIISGIFLLLILFASIFGVLYSKKTSYNEIDPKIKANQNVYLYEEVAFADEIFLKCVGISAEFDEEIYKLNLIVRVEQWNTDFYINKQKISSEMFSLKQVDVNAPSKMSVFLNSIVKATISSAIDAVTGEINVIENTVNFATNYFEGNIERASSKKGKIIKAEKNQFEPFYPYQQNGKARDVKLCFKIPQEIYESHYTLVLSIDSVKRVEKNIFLILRPNTKPYNVKFDLNGGTSEEQIKDIICQPGSIHAFPEIIPIKENHKFLYWTSKKNDKSAKIRDLYFYSYDDKTTFTIYAYYQECLNLDDVVNINDNLYLKNNTYNISVKSAEYVNLFIIKNEKGEKIIYIPKKDKKLMLLIINIEKIKEGNNHILDNNDDFYLKKDCVDFDISKYYGYLNGFKEIKPVNDYNWIGMNLSRVDTYTINLLFEIDSNIDFNDDMLFLEIDFFLTEKAKSIYIR